MNRRPSTISKQAQAKLEAQTRRNSVLEMRLAGGNFRSIADKLGVSPATVHKDYQMSMAALVDKDTADQARRVQTERYHRLLLTWWPKATGYRDANGTVHPADPKATEIVLRIIHDIRTIHGLDVKAPAPGDSPDNPVYTKTVSDAAKELGLDKMSDKDAVELNADIDRFLQSRNGGSG